MLRLLSFASLALVLACGSSRDADAAVVPDSPVPDGADGCATDDDCVLGVSHTDCCGCRTGFTNARVAADYCVTLVSEPAPPGCVRDPSCAGTACRCAPAVRAACQGGACVALDTCRAGEVLVLGRCMPACATHADCVLAANYGDCCGGCDAVHVSADAADPCLATSAAESECSPAPGSCDGLGCPSPPTDCSFGGASAVCMADGTCTTADSGGACPMGSHEMGGRCVPD